MWDDGTGENFKKSWFIQSTKLKEKKDFLKT